MKLRLVLLAVSALTASSSFHAQAWAQGMEQRVTKGPIVTDTSQRPSANPPPMGLPGSVSGTDRVTPSDHATDLAPTEALFDAINRGDVDAARDAIARGADYNGKNILGLTPLDQSIDLSRNNITFLLLSLRGATPESTQSVNTLTKGGPAPTKGAAAILAGASAPSAATKVAVQKNVSPPANSVARPVFQAQTPAQPTRGADPGMPNPQNGFLGFGS